MSKQVVLSAENITKRYELGGEIIGALKGVSLELKQGDFVAIMGPSGSGKSTLLHILGLLDAPDSGDLTIAGQNTASLNDDGLTKMRREHLGFVFQNFELIPNLSAKENIVLPATIAGFTGKKSAESQALETRLQNLSQILGIEDRLQHRPNQLSGGQQQRVALARALINEPVVILADEPTGNLDSTTGEEILDLFDNLHQQGRTIVMVTHEQEVAEHCQQIVRILDGQVERIEQLEK